MKTSEELWNDLLSEHPYNKKAEKDVPNENSNAEGEKWIQRLLTSDCPEIESLFK